MLASPHVATLAEVELKLPEEEVQQAKEAEAITRAKPERSEAQA